MYQHNYAEGSKNVIDTLESAIPRLPDDDQSFARDLVRKGREFGLSQKQLYWARRFIAQVNGTGTQSVRVDNFSGIVALFINAANKLKYPKVRLRTSAGTVVHLAPCGDNSRYRGAINLKGNEYNSEGAKAWYGRINMDGSVVLARDAEPMRDQLVELLARLSADPASTAAEYGKLTGQCCLCNRPLEDAKSTAMGYGPICAERWGLPWGTKRAAA